jgi:hypothetical protein
VEICNICGEEFENREGLDSHDAEHVVRPVGDHHLTYLLTLPDGCTPGRMEAAVALASAYRKLRDKHSNQGFHLVPFSYSEGGRYIDTILAIAV